jgi:hypothetical protein
VTAFCCPALFQSSFIYQHPFQDHPLNERILITSGQLSTPKAAKYQVVVWVKMVIEDYKKNS